MYNGINWMGWLLLILFFFGSIFVLFMLFGYGAFVWIAMFVGACVFGLISGVKTKYKQPEDRPSEFTTEDFMHCKIGEWVSRK